MHLRDTAPETTSATTTEAEEEVDADRGQVDAAAAEVYEARLVPAMFGQFLDVVLDAAGVGAGDRVLDVGSGTGGLAVAASRRVGDAGEVVGVDPNPGMRAVAARAGAPVAWRAGVAEDLPFPDDRFDRVLCQFVAMFLEDGPAAMAELARVLAPGGTAVVATWSGLATTPGFAVLVDLLRTHVGEEAAAALEAPYCLGTEAALADLVGVAFPDVVVERHEGTARFASVADLVEINVRGWTFGHLVDDATEARLRTEAERALAAWVDDQGRLAFPAPALVATATA